MITKRIGTVDYNSCIRTIQAFLFSLWNLRQQIMKVKNFAYLRMDSFLAKLTLKPLIFIFLFCFQQIFIICSW